MRWPVVALVFSVSGCGAPADGDPPGTLVSASSAAPARSAARAVSRRPHPQLDGRSFPDRVLALTWDDGPDSGTLRLADYLAAHRISATFFVVDEWAHDLSEEPGRGAHEFETGYAYIPILGDLVALGHRIGNHTANHVLLASAKPGVVDFELRENQRRIDPFLTNELRVFRSPGGAWDDYAGTVVDADPLLEDLVGPVRWDIDKKDWESSLYCRSDHPEIECEPAAPGHKSRVRAEVTAKRYVDAIEVAGHGIVLFHDRVGDVGSDYAMRVARHVVPELEKRGYVFAAPVLAFSPFRARLADSLTVDWASSLEPSSVQLVDVDEDGHADLCGVGTGGVSCARSVERPGTGDDGRPEALFGWSASWAPSSPRPVRDRELQGDLNGDGRSDRCRRDSVGIVCALEGPHGPLATSVWLEADRPDASPWLDGQLLLGDVNGDGRADLCSLANGDVACALAP